MDKLEEILPNIVEFLTKDLAHESLTKSTEQKRRNYVSTLKSLQPDLDTSASAASDVHKASDALTRIKRSITHPRSSSASAIHRSKVKSIDQQSIRSSVNYEDLQDNGMYDVIPGADEDPVEKSGDSKVKKGNKADDGSATEYESYDDDNGESGDKVKPKYDEVQWTIPSTQGQPAASRLKTPADDLAGCTYKGHLYHSAGLLKTRTKRFCAIRGKTFYCYKSAKDLQLVLTFALDGYDVTCQKKVEHNAKTVHELRLTRPGYETYWFYANEEQDAQKWLKELNTAAASATNNRLSTLIVTENTEADFYEPLDNGNSVSLDESGENISGGSLQERPSTSLNKKTSGSASTLPCDLSDRQSNSGGSARKKHRFKAFIETIGKKAGKVLQQVPSQNSSSDPNNPAGYFDVTSDLSSITRTQPCRLYCVAKSGVLFCFREISDSIQELSLPLSGTDISVSNKDITVRRSGSFISLRVSDSALQKRWHSVLLKQAELSPGQRNSGVTEYDDIGTLVNKLQARVPCAIYEEMMSPSDAVRCKSKLPPPLPTSSPPITPPPAPHHPIRKPTDDYLEPNEIQDLLSNARSKQTRQAIYVSGRSIDDTYVNAAHIDRRPLASAHSDEKLQRLSAGDWSSADRHTTSKDGGKQVTAGSNASSRSTSRAKASAEAWMKNFSQNDKKPENRSNSESSGAPKMRDESRDTKRCSVFETATTQNVSPGVTEVSPKAGIVRERMKMFQTAGVTTT